MQRSDSLTAKDLIELRDFGGVDTGGGAEPSFSVSADGAWLALTLRRADVASNSYCVGVVLVATKSGIAPRLLDVGGEFIPSANDIRGVPGIVGGSPNLGTPTWSADGKWLVYRRRDRGITQIWRAGLDGAAAPLTNLQTDADFHWNADGRSITITYRSGLIVGREDYLARDGYVYDSHFWTLSEAAPRPRLPLVISEFRIDVASGTVQSDVAGGVNRPTNDGAPLGWRTSIELMDASKPFGAHRLRIDGPRGALPCVAEICDRNVSAFWWFGRALFFRQDGSPSNGGRLSFFRWDVASHRRPTLLLETTDAIFGCLPGPSELLCARESAAHPRTIVRIDVASWQIRTLYDPNSAPALSQLKPVRRLVWKDSADVQSYADLVLPPHHKKGQKHPLIIVQYQSRGFLRGGTGDEYPIQLFAARGFAVLSFQKPALLLAAANGADLDAVQRANVAGWAERRMILRSLEAGIDAALATGAVDGEQIGITGLSDGSAQTQFAMLHSHRIKSAAMSSCCEDPSEMYVAGTAYADALLRWGYPAIGTNDEHFWRDLSLSRNAASLLTPLLLQSADNEYRMALETFGALKQTGAPVELYVYPNEYHVKVQPAHRAAVYRRSVAWFDFWLMKNDRPEGATADELARWQSMRASSSTTSAASILPTSNPGLGIEQTEQPRTTLAVH